MTNDEFVEMYNNYSDELYHAWVTSKDASIAARQRARQKAYNQMYYKLNKSKWAQYAKKTPSVKVGSAVGKMISDPDFRKDVRQRSDWMVESFADTGKKYAKEGKSFGQEVRKNADKFVDTVANNFKTSRDFIADNWSSGMDDIVKSIKKKGSKADPTMQSRIKQQKAKEGAAYSKSRRSEANASKSLKRRVLRAINKAKTKARNAGYEIGDTARLTKARLTPGFQEVKLKGKRKKFGKYYA